MLLDGFVVEGPDLPVSGVHAGEKVVLLGPDDTTSQLVRKGCLVRMGKLSYFREQLGALKDLPCAIIC